MDTLLRDLKYGVRGLRRTPGFTLAAVLALALGIGATTAIFSVVNAALLRSLGYGDESRVVSVTAFQKGLGWTNGPISPPEAIEMRTLPVFDAAGAFARHSAALQTGDRAERIDTGEVTAGFFEALNVHPRYGRTFTAAEDLKGNEGVALISASAWRRRFGGDPAAVGKSVTIDGLSRQIIGVLPDGFSYEGARDFYIPFGFTTQMATEWRGYRFLEVVARLKPGVTLQGARAALAEYSKRTMEKFPNNYPKDFGWGVTADPIRERFTSSSREPLLLLLGAVGLVLLIACANVANLLLARAAQRGREFALRAAIGASRSRIVRQLLTEGVLLAVSGALLGVVLAMWGLSGLLATAPRQIRELGDVRMSGSVLGFSIALTFATTMLFALVPALRASKVDLATTLKEGSRGTGGTHATRLRGALVAAQVAISLVLLAGAGLMMRSFSRVLDVSPGFDPDGVVSAVVAPTGAAYEGEYAAPGAARRSEYFQQALRAAAAIPGVQVAGGIDNLPGGGARINQTYFIEGYELRAGQPNPTDDMRFVTEGYFAAMKQAVVAGRAITAADDFKAPQVAMVNETWARTYFPGKDVVGRRFRIDDETQSQWRTIVGVVADTHEKGLDQPPLPVFYLSALQSPPNRLTIVARGHVTPESLRAALAQVDPAQPVDKVMPVSEVLAATLAGRKFPLQLIGLFAALALVLSAIGIYGVTSYGVAQRTREIGLRMAVGASAGSVLRMVVGGALRTTLLGLVFGAAGALAAGQVIASQLYGVGPRDPVTYLAIAGLLSLVALLASAVPAWRAARIDPMAALRTE